MLVKGHGHGRRVEILLILLCRSGFLARAKESFRKPEVRRANAADVSDAGRMRVDGVCIEEGTRRWRERVASQMPKHFHAAKPTSARMHLGAVADLCVFLVGDKATDARATKEVHRRFRNVS